MGLGVVGEGGVQLKLGVGGGSQKGGHCGAAGEGANPRSGEP